MWHRTQGLFTVSSPTSPWCPGMADHSWEHIAIATSIGIDKTSPQGTPAS
jgi:hypothetical protein